MQKFILLIALVLLFASGINTHASSFGPYKGKIVDAETKKPIEGVVVLVEWREIPFFGGSKFIDAQETVTRKDGKFHIPGIWVFNPLKRLGAMNSITIYKSGYKAREWSFNDWSEINLKVDGVLKFEGKAPVIMVEKLSMNERKKYLLPGQPSLVGHKYHQHKSKWRLFRLETNKELKILGYKPTIDQDGFGGR